MMDEDWMWGEGATDYDITVDQGMDPRRDKGV